MVISESSSSGLDRLYYSQSSGAHSLIPLACVGKRLKTVHHPAIGVLRKSSEKIIRRMHMSVDKSRKYSVMIHIQDFLRLIHLIYVLKGNKVYYLASVYDHGHVRFKSYAFSLHGIKKRCFNDHIYFFHGFLPIYYHRSSGKQVPTASIIDHLDCLL